MDVMDDDTQMKATPSHAIVGKRNRGQKTIALSTHEDPPRQHQWNLSHKHLLFPHKQILPKSSLHHQLHTHNMLHNLIFWK